MQVRVIRDLAFRPIRKSSDHNITFEACQLRIAHCFCQASTPSSAKTRRESIRRDYNVDNTIARYDKVNPYSKCSQGVCQVHIMLNYNSLSYQSWGGGGGGVVGGLHALSRTCSTQLRSLESLIRVLEYLAAPALPFSAATMAPFVAVVKHLVMFLEGF